MATESAATSSAEAREGGWELKTWTDGVPIALSSYYLIPEDLRPRQVKVGRKNIVIESPREWLERMAARGGVPSKRRVPA